MSRIVKVPGLPDMSVKEAKALVDQIKSSVHDLGPPARPQYSCPVSEEVLLADLRDLAARMLRSLNRPNPPQHGRVTQFGVSASVHGWQISLSVNGFGTKPGIHTNTRTEEYGVNEDGETDTVELPEGLLERVQLAVESGLGRMAINDWKAGHWISAEYDIPCPESLAKAYSRYKAFEGEKLHEQFRIWFEAGL